MDAGVVRDWLIKDHDVNNHDQSPRFHCAANGAVFWKIQKFARSTCADAEI